MMLSAAMQAPVSKSHAPLSQSSSERQARQVLSWHTGEVPLHSPADAHCTHAPVGPHAGVAGYAAQSAFTAQAPQVFAATEHTGALAVQPLLASHE